MNYPGSEDMDFEEREAFVLQQDILRQIFDAKMQATRPAAEKHDNEMFDAKVDMWDWIAYACSFSMDTERGSSPWDEEPA